MAQQRQVVRNAADRKQVRDAVEKERRDDARWLDNLRATLATREGRAVLWGFIQRAGVYTSVMDPSGSRVHYHAGWQDCGFKIRDECIRADRRLYLLMEAEARDIEAADDREIDALHTQRAVTQDGERD